MTHTWEKAPGSGIPAAPNGIHRVFSYDALYRLTRATGREAATAGPQDPWATAVPRGALLPDPADTRVYVRLYDYTKASAVERLRHRAIGESGHDFTRTFEVPTATTGVNAGLPLDRLSRISVASTSPSGSADYVYDGLGQLVREGTARHTAWSASGKPRSFRVQVEHSDGTAASPSVYARYLYDSSGTRIRKVTRQQDGGGLSETELSGVRLDAERDATGAVIRTESATTLPEGFELRAGTPHADDGRPAVRQRLMDRNGSAVATVGGASMSAAYVLVSREEYFPYGETALGGATRASARFDGKRRDAESGMYDYGLRTYAAWTCRFTSVDPLVGEYPELSAYGYAGGQPVTMIDLDGAKRETPQRDDTRLNSQGQYDPLGLQMPGHVYISGSTTREGYTEHELDAETGMNYAGARYYNPALGRWTSVDPLAGEFAPYSPYNYALNNPLSLVDPDGMAPCPDPPCKGGEASVGNTVGIFEGYQGEVDRKGLGVEQNLLEFYVGSLENGGGDTGSVLDAVFDMAVDLAGNEQDALLIGINATAATGGWIEFGPGNDAAHHFFANAYEVRRGRSEVIVSVAGLAHELSNPYQFFRDNSKADRIANSVGISFGRDLRPGTPEQLSSSGLSLGPHFRRAMSGPPRPSDYIHND